MGDYLINSPQSTQSAAIPVTCHEKACPPECGFTRTNLFNIIHCPEVLPDREIVHALSGQLSWTHFRENKLINSLQSTQRSQSAAIPATGHEKAPLSRRGTQMTRIARIFTDPCASASSAQSVFYCTPSAFVIVHPRLFFFTDEATRGK